MSLFHPNIDSFGIILKGKSIQKISLIHEKYQHQLLVNNFDLEFDSLWRYLIGKQSVQMVNTLSTAVCRDFVYQKMGITKILASRPEASKLHKKTVARYTKHGLKVYPFPDNCMRLSKVFGNDQKYGMTGIAAIVYAVDIIKPKHLWIVGFDCYQKDYLHRRPWQYPLARTKARFKEYPLLFVNHIVKKNPQIMFHMVSYYHGFPELKNLEVVT